MSDGDLGHFEEQKDMLLEGRAKLSDPLSDVSIMEDPETLCEVVGAGQLLEVFKSCSNLPLKGAWENNVVNDSCVVGVEYYHRHGAGYQINPVIRTEADTTSIMELHETMHGENIDPNTLLMIEGQLMRSMMKCVLHQHRISLFKIWTCVAVLLSGFRFTNCFIEHIENMHEESIDEREVLGHPNSLFEGVLVEGDAPRAVKLWSLVLCDVIRYRETCLRGVCHVVKSSVMVDADWEEEASAELSLRPTRSAGKWNGIILKPEEMTPPATPKKRQPLKELNKNSRRSPKSGVETWLGASEIPVSPRFSSGGNHASFEQIPITPLRGRPNIPQHLDPRSRAYI